MFRKIFAVWKQEGLLKQALDSTENMFKLAAKNFDIATKQLIGPLDAKAGQYIPHRPEDQ